MQGWLWLWVLCRIRRVDAIVAALLIDGRWTQYALSALSLLAEALLGVQALQPALRPPIQGRVLPGVGRRLAGRVDAAHGRERVVAVNLVLLVGCRQLREIGRPDGRRRALRLVQRAGVATALCTFSSEHRLRATEAAGQRWRWLTDVVGRVNTAGGGVGRKHTQALLPTRDDSD